MHESNSNKEAKKRPDFKNSHLHRLPVGSKSFLKKASSVTGGGVLFPKRDIELHRGYFKTWRKIEDSSVYKDAPCFKVFFDLLVLSKWKPGAKRIFKRKEIELKPGQLTTGRYQLAERNGMSASTVYRALKKLQDVYHCIRLESDMKWTLVTILNWDTYQIPEYESEQQPNSKRTASGHNLIKKECNKERNKGSYRSSYPQDINNYGSSVSDLTQTCFECGVAVRGDEFAAHLLEHRNAK